MTGELDYSRSENPASETEVESAAAKIWHILRSFNSPQDAVLALAIAHSQLLVAAFPPGHQQEVARGMGSYSKSVLNTVAELQSGKAL